MLSQFANQSNMKLTTTGRKSGAKRSVTVWFVVEDPRVVFVQHVTAPAHWCKNLANDPNVELDFGEGIIPGRATVIEDNATKAEILGRFRRKYFLARILQFLARRNTPFVARIDC